MKQISCPSHQETRISSWQSLWPPVCTVPCAASTRASGTLVRNRRLRDTQSSAKQLVYHNRRRRDRTPKFQTIRQQRTPSSPPLYSRLQSYPQQPPCTCLCASANHATGMPERNKMRPCTLRMRKRRVRRTRRIHYSFWMKIHCFMANFAFDKLTSPPAGADRQ